jgi:hypothetical protein
VASPANLNLPSGSPNNQTAGSLIQSPSYNNATNSQSIMMSRTLSQKTQGGKDLLLWTPNPSNAILKNSTIKRTLESRESPNRIDDRIPIG